MKLRPYKNHATDTVGVYGFWCPGCKAEHPYDVSRWAFNGSLEKPSFTPSLRCYANTRHGGCHLYLTDGKLIYCADCDHALAGQTVDLPDFPADE